MKKGSMALIRLLLSWVFLVGVGAAHHSNAVFNHEHLTTITGVVTRFAFINPHSQIYVNVEDENGNLVEWTVTGTPPSAMRRLGWTSKTFVPGEKLTITGMAYRDGRPVMIHLKISRANGESVRIGATEQGFYDEFQEKYASDPARYSKIGK